jgi:hypothetical protein
VEEEKCQMLCECIVKCLKKNYEDAELFVSLSKFKNMSGGHFDYIQTQFEWQIIEPIESLIENNGREKTKEWIKEAEPWRGDDWYEQYPNDKFHYKYPDDIIDEFKKAVYYLKIAKIYTQRIDWLVSGDDGEDSFRRRLEEELSKIKK